MWYFIIKVLISSVLIVSISEISKHSTTLGSILASVPLVSVLAIIWLYLDTKDAKQTAELSQGIFWMVIPSLLFFVLFPIMIHKSINFWVSLGTSLVVMIIAYFIMLFIFNKIGIKI